MKAILFLVTISILSFANQSLKATQQISEIVTIGDGQFQFIGFPLEQLVSKEELFEIYQIDSELLCSAAWRGYQGYWEIQGNELFLIALIGNPCNIPPNKRVVLELEKLKFDKAAIEHYGIKANWFTGELVFPISEYRTVKGKKTESGHPYLEHEVVIYEISGGNVESRKIEYRER